MANGTRSGFPSNQFGFRHPAGSYARGGNNTFLRAISLEDTLSFSVLKNAVDTVYNLLFGSIGRCAIDCLRTLRQRYMQSHLPPSLILSSRISRQALLYYERLSISKARPEERFGAI